MATLIDPPLVDDTLESLPGWNRGEGEIWREVHLPDELDTQLQDEVRLDADSMGHAVEIKRVKGRGTRFALRTPEVGGVSELDVALASRISDIAHRLSAMTPGSDEPGVHAVREDAPDIVAEGSGPLTTEAEQVDAFRKR